MSILTHSPAIVRDGLVLCLDAGAEQSWPANTKGSASNWGAEVLADGGFETWSSSTALTHWTKYIAGSSTVNRDDAEEESGTYCLRLDVDGSDSNALVYSSVACFVPGRRYRVTFSAKCSSGTLNASVYESTAATVPDNGIPDTELPLTTSYQSFVIDFTAHGNSGANQNLLFGRRSGGGGASKSIYFDNASVRELHWHDLSGNFNDADNVNAPTFSALSGSGGTKYFDFDGTNDYMTISSPSFAANGFTSGLTCEAWLRFDTASLSGSDTGFITRYSASAQSQFLFGFREAGVGNIGLTLYQIDDSNNAVGLDYDQDWTPATDRWYHVVAVYIPSTKVEIFVDGQSEFSVTSNIPSQLNDDSTLDVMIGNYVGGTYFNGRIAILRMYDRALSIAEAQQNYRTHKGRFGK